VKRCVVHYGRASDEEMIIMVARLAGSIATVCGVLFREWAAQRVVHASRCFFVAVLIVVVRRSAHSGIVS
jgi:hypothetical protein